VTTAPKKVEVTAEDLQKKLKDAVTAEDYELAAKLKKELQKKKGG
jgi:protein-arginine kinase activator protein McsA